MKGNPADRPAGSAPPRDANSAPGARAAEDAARERSIRGNGEDQGVDVNSALDEEARTREALLFMLEDLAEDRHRIEQAHRDWMQSVDALRDPLLVLDAQYRVLRCNRAYAARAGLTFHEIVGRRYWELFPRRKGPLPACGIDAGAAACGAHGQSRADEFTLDTGETFSARAFFFSDPSAGQARQLLVFEDITERKRLHDALERSEQHFRALLEHASDLVAIVDAKGIIEYVSPSISQLGGYTPDDLLGRNYLEHAHPEDAPAAAAGFAAIMRDPDLLHTTEFRFRTKDGTWRVLESVARNALADPLIHGILINARDITERKHAQTEVERRERYFRKLTEGSADAFFTIDRAGTVIYRSESGKRLTGYDTDEVFGKNIAAFVEPQEVLLARNAIAEVLANPDRIARIELHLKRKDGSTVDAEIQGKNLLDDPDVGGIVVTARDITERKRAEQAIRDERAFSDKLIASLPDVFYVLDATGRFVRWNDKFIRLLGVSNEQMPQTLAIDIMHEADRPLIARKIQEVLERGSADAESRLITKSGTREYFFTATRLVSAQSAFVIGIGIDITERRRAERELKFKSAVLLTQLETALDAILLVDENGKIVTCNQRFIDLFSVPESLLTAGEDEPVLRHVTDQTTDPAAFISRVQYLYGHTEEKSRENIPLKDGRVLDRYSAAVVAADGTYYGRVWYFRDITQRLRAEQMLRDSEEKFRSSNAAAQDAMILIDDAGAIVSWNAAAERMFGYRSDEALGQEMHRLLAPARYLPEYEKGFAAFRTSGEGPAIGKLLEFAALRKDGREFPVELSVSAVKLKDRWHAIGIMRDISERKRAEGHLRRLTWALRALGQSNSALVHAGTETELFQSCCDAIAGSEGYPLAWIGLARDDAAHSVEVIAVAGEAIDYMNGFCVSWADTPLGRGPTGCAIRSGTTQVIDDLAQSSAYLPWIERARENALYSAISLPIRSDGSVIGALTIYSREPNAFGLGEVNLFEELASDIGYGIASRRTRVAYEAGLVEREQATRKLRAAFESLIAVLATTVEQRDPYTAGHQRRVAELAAAIGQALELDPARLEGLHFAATIHDIGKIYVPAEILARPGKLPPMEFELIKAHAQVGYEILKGVDFPWPVADMIRQHHERLDGSGYPQGLKGGEILLEARILAVADVVEAMSSHRPYREGLGLDAALEHVRQEAGTRLDAQVVKACERVFREQGFAFEKP